MRYLPWTGVGCLIPLAAIVVSIASGCDGGGPPSSDSSAPKVASAKATRDVIDGVAQLTTTIDVQMDRPFEVAADKVPLASQFELQVRDIKRDANATTRVLVNKADHAAGSRGISLSVNALIPDGATLAVAKKAFQAGATGQVQATVSSDLSLGAVLLATTPLTPADSAFFNDLPAAPVKPEDRDPAVQRSALQAHLQKRGSSETTTQAALARYDTMPAEIIPSPKVRAALAALTGTFAEPAIDSLLTNQNCTGKPAALVAIQPPPDDPETHGPGDVHEGPRARGFPQPRARRRTHRAHHAVPRPRIHPLRQQRHARGGGGGNGLRYVPLHPSYSSRSHHRRADLAGRARTECRCDRAHQQRCAVAGIGGPAAQHRLYACRTGDHGHLRVVRGARWFGVPERDSGQPLPEPVADAYVAKLALVAGMQIQPAFNLQVHR